MVLAQEKPRPWTASDTSGYITAADLDLLSSEIYDRVRQEFQTVIDSLVGRDTLSFGDTTITCDIDEDTDTLTYLNFRRPDSPGNLRTYIRFFEPYGISNKYLQISGPGAGAGLTATDTIILPQNRPEAGAVIVHGTPPSNQTSWTNSLYYIDRIDCVEINVEGDAQGAGFITLYEDTDNGTNYVKIIALASLAANYTLTLPADDGNAGEYLKTDGSGNLSWDTP